MKYLFTLTMLFVSLSVVASKPAKSLAFLSKAGVDVSQLNRMPDHVDLSADDITYYPLNEKVHRLLEPVHHFSYYYDVTDDGIEGGYSIAGIRDYGDGRVLVLYSVEYGDGANVELASYNSSGRLVDFVDTGYWRNGLGLNTDDDPASDCWRFQHTTMDLPSDSQIVIHVQETIVPYEKAGAWSDADVMGHVEKTIRYTYNTQGLLHLDGIESTHSGVYDEYDYRFEDIRNIRYYPISQIERIDKLNELAARPDIVDDMAHDDYSLASYELNQAVYNLVQTNTIQVLLWLYQTPGNNLNNIFSTCAKSALIDVGMIRNELKKAPNKTVKTQLGRMIDQWTTEE